MKNFSYKSALKVFYILINADGEVTESELQEFENIGKALDEELGTELFLELKEQIVSEFNNDMATASNLGADALIKIINDVFLIDENDEDDAFLTPRWILWNMFVIAFSNGEYHSSEKRIIEYFANNTNQETSITLEMEQYIRTLNSIEHELVFVIEKDGLYSQVRPIVDELEFRRNKIIESAMQLIEDEAIEGVEQIDIQKNAYSRAKDQVKEKLSPVGDAVAEKATDVYSQAKEKIKDSGVIDEVSERAGKLADGIKAKTKEIDVEEKVSGLLKRFKKN